MVQAYAGQLLNQKDALDEDSGQISESVPAAAQHPLYDATRRLVSALNRLERNLDHVTAGRSDRDERQLALFAQENEGLRHERENLNSAISMLQNQYSELHQVASTIYNKLDDSIHRLTHIIEQ